MIEDLENSWFDFVLDNEIYDIAIEKFGFIYPSVAKLKTFKGKEYYHIEGLKIKPDKTIEIKKMYLGAFGPMFIRADGFGMVDFEAVNDNLESCMKYILFMDGKNVNRTVDSVTYKSRVQNLFDYIKSKLEKQEEQEKQA